MSATTLSPLSKALAQPKPSYLEQYANYVIGKYHEEFLIKAILDAEAQSKSGANLPAIPPHESASYAIKAEEGGDEATALGLPVRERLNVGIIGAGAAGLYAAMILEDLKRQPEIAAKFDIDYTVLEAQKGHIGGRLLTHHFSDGPNDYYDVGAMRFPDTPVMWRTFDLFRRLKFKGDYSDSPGAGSDVIPYYLHTEEDIQCFNGKSIRQRDIKKHGTDPFGVAPTVPLEYVERGAAYWIDAKLGYFKEQLKLHNKNGEGFKILMEYDNESVRQFMATIHPKLEDQFRAYMQPRHPEYKEEKAYPQTVINWLETFNSGTTMYDTGFSEAVIEELDFDFGPNVQWKCIQGGANRIARTMANTLPAGKVLQSKRVVKIAPRTQGGHAEASEMLVEVEGEAEPRHYDHVISTIPLGALRMVDLDECGLSYPLRQALRALQYGASVKIGIRFTHRWWEEKDQNHRGGVSTTDRLPRMIVYPSYGIDGPDATMLVSYSWSMDSLRLGAFAKGSGSLAEERMVNLILNDLAKVHQISYEKLKSWCIDYHAYNWYSNEFTVGAFALFGPGQFSNMYKEVTQPAGKMHLHFAGEGTSTNHAWVVGALDSSVRALAQVFTRTANKEILSKTLDKRWSMVNEMPVAAAAKQVLGCQNGGKTYGKIFKESQRV